MPAQTHHLTFTEGEVRKRYVSWDRGEAEREWACLTVLAQHAPGVAPRPLRRDTENGAPVIVMERLPGQPLAGTPLSRTQTAALGRALRRLYDVPLDALTAAGIQERINGPTDHAATVAIWLSHSPDLAACRDPDLVGRAIQTALRWLAQSDPPPPPRLETLGIADLNPANVVWDGETCRLVDFEDGGLTEPAYELADHVEHLAGRLTRSFDPVGLVAAVGLSADDQRRMRAYRPLWAAFWLAMLLPGNRGFDRNPPGTTELQAAHLLALLDGRFSRS